MLQSPPLEGGFGIFVVIACIITYGSQPVGLIYALGIAMGWW